MTGSAGAYRGIREDAPLFLHMLRAGVAWFHYTLPGPKVKHFIAKYIQNNA